MGLLDIFNKELESSWNDPEVKKWKQSAKNVLQSYYLGFRGSQFDEYEKNDQDKLQAKICYSMFGPPTVEAEELIDGYTDEQKSSANEILNKILEVIILIIFKNKIVYFLLHRHTKV